MHWKSWEQMSRPKNVGGLRFQDIEAFNMAMLGKQLWTMITHKESLMARVFKRKYFPKGDSLTACLDFIPSFVWKSIHAAHEMIRQGAILLIGSGNNIKVWADRWLSMKPTRPAHTTNKVNPCFHYLLSPALRGRDLLVNDGKEWNNELLDIMFLESERKLIEENRPGGITSEDRYTWDFTKFGLNTVKSGYWVATSLKNKAIKDQEITQPSLDALYQRIWKTKTSPKIQHFLWKCINNCLLVVHNLTFRHLSKDSSCVRCQGSVEDVNHKLLCCPFARLVWAVSTIPAPPNGEMSDSFYTNLCRVLHMPQGRTKNTESEDITPWIMWNLWKNRNNFLYKGTLLNAHEVIRRTMEDAKEWCERTEAKNTELQIPCLLQEIKNGNILHKAGSNVPLMGPRLRKKLYVNWMGVTRPWRQSYVVGSKSITKTEDDH